MSTPKVFIPQSQKVFIPQFINYFMTEDISQYVKQTLKLHDLIPVFIEFDRASQLKTIQLYPSVIAILKSVVKPEHVDKIEEFDIELTTSIVEYFKQKIPLDKIILLLRNEKVDANPDVVAKYAKEKIKIKDMKVIFDHFDKQMQTNTLSLYSSVTAMVKAVLRDDINPEDLDVNDAFELVAYAMTKIDVNRLQTLLLFLT
jgi:hypothetical protein